MGFSLNQYFVSAPDLYNIFVKEVQVVFISSLFYQKIHLQETVSWKNAKKSTFQQLRREMFFFNSWLSSSRHLWVLLLPFCSQISTDCNSRTSRLEMNTTFSPETALFWSELFWVKAKKSIQLFSHQNEICFCLGFHESLRSRNRSINKILSLWFSLL